MDPNLKTFWFSCLRRDGHTALLLCYEHDNWAVSVSETGCTDDLEKPFLPLSLGHTHVTKSKVSLSGHAANPKVTVSSTTLIAQ